MRTNKSYTPITVTLTEGEIGIVNCSLEAYIMNMDEETKLNSGLIREVDDIVEELESAVDDHYNEKDGYYGGTI